MSWSVSAIGKPAAVKRAIEEGCAKYGPGPSRDEFEAAKPHLMALVDQAVGNVAVQINACGSQSRDIERKVTQGTIDVTIKTHYGFIE